jgi:hypothetical protein
MVAAPFSHLEPSMIRLSHLSMTMLPLAALAACGSASEDGVGGVSASEASALNEAAATLDAQSGAAQNQGAGLNPAAITAAEADRGRHAPTPPPANAQEN